MWSPQICLFLVVTPFLACAAPAAKKAPNQEKGSIQQHLVNVDSEDLTVKRSVNVDSLDSTVKRSARIDSFLAIPSTGFSCSAQAVPGIYADQETGCQVFHYCQEDGRMDSFFCPNLTLFNQQYFVCDWEFNVNCDAANQYFSLNEALYKTPEKIYQAINPAIKIVQNELLQGAASSEVSRTLNSLVSKLDSRTSAIVIDSSPSQSSFAKQPQNGPVPRVPTVINQNSKANVKDLNILGSEREGKSFDIGLNSYDISANDKIASSAVQIGQPPVLTVTVSPVIKNVSPVVAINAGQAVYATTNDPYDDAVADPEPDCYYSGTCNPSVGGSYTSLDTSAGNAYNPTTQDDDGYDDAIADPEPACFYTGDCGQTIPNSVGSIGSLSKNSYNAISTDYGSSENSAYDDAVADPEPVGYSSNDPLVSGVSLSSQNGIDNSNYATQSQAKVPSYDSIGSVYDPYDSSDPEPSAIPYSASGSYGQYDSADPEPNTAFGYYDSADPEPAAYYGANTVDLSTSSKSSYNAPANAQYAASDQTIDLSIDFDDAPADPEPDPSSYASDVNLYDSSVSNYQEPGYKSFSPINALSEYYKGYPSQGLVIDSADPEPSADPEFTPYGG